MRKFVWQIHLKRRELLGKHYGMFGGKSESGGGDVIIVDNIEKAEQIKGAEKCSAVLTG